MCGRWYVDMMADDELEEYYARLKNKNGIKIKGDIYPSDHIMVIANNKNSIPSVFNMKWGYTIGKHLAFNARMESLNTKEIFMDGIQNRRCVIPANYYYEWKKDTKEKHSIQEKSHPVLYFLGIYRFENEEPVCTIITKNASPEMVSLHDRMPVIIPKELINDWLKKDVDVNLIFNQSLENLTYTKCDC